MCFLKGLFFKRSKNKSDGKTRKATDANEQEHQLREKLLSEVRELLDEEVADGAPPSASDIIFHKYKEGEIPYWKAANLAREGLSYCNELDDLVYRFYPREQTGKRTGPLPVVSGEDIVRGAIYGDITGSPYEGFRQNDIKDAIDDPYEMGCRMTDDSYLTMATYSVIKSGDSARLTKREMTLKDICERSSFPFEYNPYTHAYRAMAKRFPNAGYGSAFYYWFKHNDSENPYGSLGNGSAMRVSPVGAFVETKEDVIIKAAESAMATHNHREGVKGAIVTAMCIWMARNGFSKEDIFQYMRRHYSYGVKQFENFTYEEARHTSLYQVQCSYSVPAAVIAFHESTSFMDAIEKAACAGFDTDTNACICGGIAAAYYGLPDKAREVVNKELEKNGLNF